MRDLRKEKARINLNKCYNEFLRGLEVAMANSIFDEAGKTGRKKESEAPKAQSPTKEPSSLVERQKTSDSREEIWQTIARLQKSHDEIQKRLEEVYAKTGFTPQDIKNFLENPNNFTLQQWEFIQKERQELFSHLMNGFNSVGISLSENHKPKEKRRKKSPDARRNWIPIH